MTDASYAETFCESSQQTRDSGYGSLNENATSDPGGHDELFPKRERDVYRSLADYGQETGSIGDEFITHLIEAEQRSDENIAEMRAYIKRKLRGVKGLDIVAFGSLARKEWTLASDFDYLVMVHELTEASTLREALRVAHKARARLEASEPGATGMFGVIVSASELIARIGLETDTNQTMTRRLLMLEESVSLYDDVSHTNFMQNMFGRYLIEYQTRADKTGVPRFLLNDVVRHWRTVAVDYQAKNWQRVTDEGWGLRYLKLRLSRKMAYAGTLAPLLQIALEGVELQADALQRLFEPPPLVRLSNLHPFLHEEGRAALLNSLRIAGRFNMLLNDADFRKSAGSVVDKENCTDESFLKCLEEATELQTHLSEVFLGSESPLKQLSGDYLVF